MSDYCIILVRKDGSGAMSVSNDGGLWFNSLESTMNHVDELDKTKYNVAFVCQLRFASDFRSFTTGESECPQVE